MKFSVLIASYNNANYLKSCLQSVLDQTYEDFEIVIVDDFSTDDSIEVANYYQSLDARIRIYQNNKNEGAGFTKKRCLDLAHGEICGYLDPDDELDLLALEKMVKLHQQYPGCSMVYSTHYICDEYLNVICVNPNIRERRKDIPLAIEMCVSHFATFKLDKYLLTRGVDPSYRRAVDHDLYFLLDTVGELIYIDEPLYYYRHQNNSISLGKNRYKAEYWDWIIRHEHLRKDNIHLEMEYSAVMQNRREMPGRFGDFLENVYKFYVKIYKLLKT